MNDNTYNISVEQLVARWQGEVARVHQTLTERAIQAELIAAALQDRVAELEAQLAPADAE